MDSEVKIAAIIATVFIMLFWAIADGVTTSDYIKEQTKQKCIQSNKVWAENACVNSVDDLKYVDNG